MPNSLRALMLALVVAAPACGSSTGPTVPPDARILFIGNSFTYEDSLGERVAAILRQAGDSNVRVVTVGFPNFSLEDHWNEGTAPGLLRSQRWDYVVMQQGPSSTPENREYLAVWTEKFAPLIRAAGAEPVLFGVWPSLRDTARFALVDTSYREAARRVQGTYAPAGNAWHRLLGTDYALGAELYEVDAFHPTLLGTYLAAVVIACRIKHCDPEQLPDVAPGFPPIVPGFPQTPFSIANVRKLQDAASWALRNSPSRP